MCYQRRLSKATEAGFRVQGRRVGRGSDSVLGLPRILILQPSPFLWGIFSGGGVSCTPRISPSTPLPRLCLFVPCNPKLVFVLEVGRPTAQLTFDLGWGRVLLQLDSDDLLDNPGEAQSAFYEGPGVSGPGARGLWWQPVGEGRRGSHSSPEALCREGVRGQSLRSSVGWR